MTGRDIKVLRARLGLSQTELGKLVGKHYRTIQQWEAKTSIPKSDQLLLRPYFEKAGMAYLLDDYEEGDTPAKTAGVTEVGAIDERNLSANLLVLLAEVQQVNTYLLEQNAKLMKIIERSAD